MQVSDSIAHHNKAPAPLMCVVIVTYVPCFDNVLRLIDSLGFEHQLIFIDNTPNGVEELICSEAFHDARCIVRQNYANLGIAAAQNQGIEVAFELGADFVLFLDQDSEFNLQNANELLEIALKSPRDVFCATPVAREEGIDINQSGHIQIKICRDLMSSGSIIPTNVFNRVGLFEEALFIDCVDYEWGWRARNLGINIYLVPNIIFPHVWGSGGSVWTRTPTPVRNYYQTRNVLFMLFRFYVPTLWKLQQCILLPSRFARSLIFGGAVRQRLSYFIQGVVHAVACRGGVLRE